jgi:MoaA/NifB/PqqE/SkfB family radical SAM enzyme
MAQFLKEHLIPQTSRDGAKALFKRAVLRVEVETHSYCNRRCGYCPNVVGDRLGDNKRMPDRIFARIFDDLAEIDYDQIVVFSGYNEPLADRHILARISQARRSAPKSTIRTYTNGDYLKPDYVEALAEAGLSSMHISVHMNPEDVYSDTYALNRIAEIAERLHIRPEFKSVEPNFMIVARFPHKRLDIEVRAIDYWVRGENRAGLIEGIKEGHVRRAPCHFPFLHLYVGFEGHLVPCCHIRGDRPEHAKYRVGNIDDFGSIYEAFASKAMVGWRRHLAGFEKKASPCDTCSAPFLEGGDKPLRDYAPIYRRLFEPILRQDAVKVAD